MYQCEDMAPFLCYVQMKIISPGNMAWKGLKCEKLPGIQKSIYSEASKERPYWDVWSL